MKHAGKIEAPALIRAFASAGPGIPAPAVSEGVRAGVPPAAVIGGGRKTAEPPGIGM